MIRASGRHPADERGSGFTPEKLDASRPIARRHNADERGSGTVLMLGVMMVVMLLGSGLLVVGGYAITSHRAEAAADLAALAGAQAHAAGADACAAAKASAQRNQASVDDCAVAGDQRDFVVTVRTVLKSNSKVPGLPTEVFGTAHAGPV